MSLKDLIRIMYRRLKGSIPAPLKLLVMHVRSFIGHPPGLCRLDGELLQAPLISCICVTRARPELLRRSIHCFRAQTWPNKELVILYEDDDYQTRDFLASMRDGDVRTIKIRSIPRISLGELRNIAIRASRGSLFCQWDDDDWFHPERLATQYAYLRGNRADACLLNHWIVFDTKTGSAYISPKWNWEGSILCKRKAFSKNVSYAHISKGEDTVFINRLKKNHSIALLNRPHLYIYVYHGDNTWDRQHWDSNIFSSESYPLGDFFSSKIQEIISGHISGEATVRMLRSIHMISLVQYQK